MVNITVNKKSFAVPSTWQEISHSQLLAVSEFLLGTKQSEPMRRLSVLLQFVPSLKKYWWHTAWVNSLVTRWKWMQKIYPVLTDGQKWDLLQLTSFMFNDISGKAIIKNFVHKGQTYYLPEDNFTRESIIAFAFADEYFNQYTQTGDLLCINLLVACLARQEGSTEIPALQKQEGDIREHFSTSRTLERAKAFEKLDPAIRSAVLIYFLGGKKFLHKQYEILFKKKEPKRDVLPGTEVEDMRASFGKKKIPKPEYGWLGIIYDLSEQGTFGNFDQVKHMFLHTCCYYLAKKKYENEERS